MQAVTIYVNISNYLVIASLDNKWCFYEHAFDLFFIEPCSGFHSQNTKNEQC